MNQEADAFGRPDYRDTLFGPDGVKRERMRVARGLAMVRSRPFWFLGVMVRRAGGMLKLERARLISADPPVTNSLDACGNQRARVGADTRRLCSQREQSYHKAQRRSFRPTTRPYLRGDDSRYGKQFATAPVQVQKNADYLWRVPIKLEQGRIKIGVESADQKSLYASTIVDTLEGKSSSEQPTQDIALPFVSGSDNHVRLVLANEGAKHAGCYPSRPC